MVAGQGFMMVALMGIASAGFAQERDFAWSGALQAGQEISVRGISGDIVAELASGTEARVEARKEGRSSDFDRVEVRVVDTGNGVVVCVIYDPRGDSGDCSEGAREDRRRGDGANVSVDFHIYVPAGVTFSGRTVSGDVEAAGLRSDVYAETVSGDVTVTTSGVASGTTVSGDVHVELGSLDWDRLDFETVSGDIEVGVPQGVDTAIEFESVAGDFDSDFDLRILSQSGRWVGKKLEATIGDGARTMTFKTVNGDARLRRAGGTP
jgi:DUF4097 and DUF4098 domain-containing protein YvlB